MVRAAAKNHDHVAVVVDPADYGPVLDELRDHGAISLETRRRLARQAFAHTAGYDAAIVAWLDERDQEALAAGEDVDAPGSTPPPCCPRPSTSTLERAASLRYGENPHQHGARYRVVGRDSWWDHVVQHGGKELSYLNVFDADAAWRLVHELPGGVGGRAVAIIKHANPCGAALDDDLVPAYERALECDPQSAFGGIVAIGGPVTLAVSEAIAAGPQADVIIAPSYDEDALAQLSSRRKATRLLSAPAPEPLVRQYRFLGDTVLVQDPDRFVADPSTWEVATARRPTDAEWRDLAMAWTVCARTTSNAIAVVTDAQAVGVGAGQQSRVVAARSPWRRPRGGPRAGRPPPTPSSPSPTDSRSWPTPGWRPWSSRAARSGTTR